MIKINLLTYPEELKKSKANTELSVFFAVVLVLCLVLFLFHKSRRSILNQLKVNISQINTNIDNLKDVETLHTKIMAERDKVRAKLNSINAVTKVKRNPVRHLNELTAIIPDALWFTKFSLNANNISMDCRSMSYYDVSRFYNNIKGSKYFKIDKFPSIAEVEKFGDKPIYQFSLYCSAEGLVIEASDQGTENANKKDTTAEQNPAVNKS